MRVLKSGVLNVYDSRGVGVGQIADNPTRADLLARLRGFVQQSAPAAE